MTPRAFDRVIDDVARDMTGRAPTPDFRARVMERVSATRPAGRLTLLAGNWRAAGVAAAVVVGVIAVTVMQPFRTGEPSPSVARVTAPVRPAAAPSDPLVMVEAPPSPRATRRPAEPRPSAALVAWRARNIPALEDPAALELDQIQPAGLSISQLSVRPLDIAPIAIASIVEGGR